MNRGLIVRVRLPANRDRAGLIEVIDHRGRAPLHAPVAARASDEAAARSGNATREPTLPYGDTPLGDYSIARVVATGAGLDPREYGARVLVLQPRAGQAALADALGRFHLFVQGGATGPRGALRATSGSLRLRDRDLARLAALVEDHGIRALRCERFDAAAGAPIVTRTGAVLDDPPRLVETRGRAQSRRTILAVGVRVLAGAAVLGRSAFAWADADGSGPTEYGEPPDAGTPPDGGAPAAPPVSDEVRAHAFGDQTAAPPAPPPESPDEVDNVVDEAPAAPVAAATVVQDVTDAKVQIDAAKTATQVLGEEIDVEQDERPVQKPAAEIVVDRKQDELITTPPAQPATGAKDAEEQVIEIKTAAAKGEATTIVDPSAEAAADYAGKNLSCSKYGEGHCAAHVTAALEHSGIALDHDVGGYAASGGQARLLGPVLEDAGFQSVYSYDGKKDDIDLEKYEPKKGDVVVIQSPGGKQKAGHAAIYNGTDWVSDFVQRDQRVHPDDETGGMYPGSSYRDKHPAFTVYRKETNAVGGYQLVTPEKVEQNATPATGAGPSALDRVLKTVGKKVPSIWKLKDPK